MSDAVDRQRNASHSLYLLLEHNRQLLSMVGALNDELTHYRTAAFTDQDCPAPAPSDRIECEQALAETRHLLDVAQARVQAKDRELADLYAKFDAVNQECEAVREQAKALWQPAQDAERLQAYADGLQENLAAMQKKLAATQIELDAARRATDGSPSPVALLRWYNHSRPVLRHISGELDAGVSDRRTLAEYALRVEHALGMLESLFATVPDRAERAEPAP